MIDPRNEIVALFTNSRILGTTDYGDAYVQVYLREDWDEDETLEGSDLGTLVLEEPTIHPAVVCVGGKTYEETITLICNLWVYKHKSMKNPEDFVKSIVNVFQNTIIDNHSTMSDVEDIWLGEVIPVPSQSKEVYRKTILLYATGHKIRS